jgi:hypothetical protein
MSFIDFTVYILGIYGLAWLLVHSAFFSFFRDFIFVLNIEFFKNLISCIVCTSVWLSIYFVFFYFPAECWYTKLLIVGTTTTTTWALANLLGDID